METEAGTPASLSEMKIKEEIKDLNCSQLDTTIYEASTREIQKDEDEHCLLPQFVKSFRESDSTDVAANAKDTANSVTADEVGKAEGESLFISPLLASNASEDISRLSDKNAETEKPVLVEEEALNGVLFEEDGQDVEVRHGIIGCEEIDGSDNRYNTATSFRNAGLTADELAQPYELFSEAKTADEKTPLDITSTSADFSMQDEKTENGQVHDQLVKKHEIVYDEHLSGRIDRNQNAKEEKVGTSFQDVVQGNKSDEAPLLKSGEHVGETDNATPDENSAIPALIEENLSSDGARLEALQHMEVSTENNIEVPSSVFCHEGESINKNLGSEQGGVKPNLHEEVTGGKEQDNASILLEVEKGPVNIIVIEEAEDRRNKRDETPQTSKSHKVVEPNLHDEVIGDKEQDNASILLEVEKDPAITVIEEEYGSNKRHETPQTSIRDICKTTAITSTQIQNVEADIAGDEESTDNRLDISLGTMVTQAASSLKAEPEKSGMPIYTSSFSLQNKEETEKLEEEEICNGNKTVENEYTEKQMIQEPEYVKCSQEDEEEEKKHDGKDCKGIVTTYAVADIHRTTSKDSIPVKNGSTVSDGEEAVEENSQDDEKKENHQKIEVSKITGESENTKKEITTSTDEEIIQENLQADEDPEKVEGAGVGKATGKQIIQDDGTATDLTVSIGEEDISSCTNYEVVEETTDAAEDTGAATNIGEVASVDNVNSHKEEIKVPDAMPMELNFEPTTSEVTDVPREEIKQECNEKPAVSTSLVPEVSEEHIEGNILEITEAFNDSRKTESTTVNTESKTLHEVEPAVLPSVETSSVPIESGMTNVQALDVEDGMHVENSNMHENHNKNIQTTEKQDVDDVIEDLKYPMTEGACVAVPESEDQLNEITTGTEITSSECPRQEKSDKPLESSPSVLKHPIETIKGNEGIKDDNLLEENSKDEKLETPIVAHANDEKSNNEKDNYQFEEASKIESEDIKKETSMGELQKEEPSASNDALNNLNRAILVPSEPDCRELGSTYPSEMHDRSLDRNNSQKEIYSESAWEDEKRDENKLQISETVKTRDEEVLDLSPQEDNSEVGKQDTSVNMVAESLVTTASIVLVTRNTRDEVEGAVKNLEERFEERGGCEICDIDPTRETGTQMKVEDFNDLESIQKNIDPVYSYEKINSAEIETCHKHHNDSSASSDIPGKDINDRNGPEEIQQTVEASKISINIEAATSEHEISHGSRLTQTSEMECVNLEKTGELHSEVEMHKIDAMEDIRDVEEALDRNLNKSETGGAHTEEKIIEKDGVTTDLNTVSLGDETAGHSHQKEEEQKHIGGPANEMKGEKLHQGANDADASASNAILTEEVQEGCKISVSSETTKEWIKEDDSAEACMVPESSETMEEQLNEENCTVKNISSLAVEEGTVYESSGEITNADNPVKVLEGLDTADASHEVKNQTMEKQKTATCATEVPTREETITKGSQEAEKEANKQEGEVMESDLISEQVRLEATDSERKTEEVAVGNDEDQNKSSVVFTSTEASDKVSGDKLDHISSLVSEISKEQIEEIHEDVDVQYSKLEASCITMETENKQLPESELETANVLDSAVHLSVEMIPGLPATEASEATLQTINVEALMLEETINVDNANEDTPRAENPDGGEAEGRKYGMLEKVSGTLPECQKTGAEIEETSTETSLDNKSEDKLQDPSVLPAEQYEYESTGTNNKSNVKIPIDNEIQEKTLEIPSVTQSEEEMPIQIDPRNEKEATEMDKPLLSEPENHILERDKFVELTQFSGSSNTENSEPCSEKEKSEGKETRDESKEPETTEACPDETNEASEATNSETLRKVYERLEGSEDDKVTENQLIECTPVTYLFTTFEGGEIINKSSQEDEVDKRFASIGSEASEKQIIEGDVYVDELHTVSMEEVIVKECFHEDDEFEDLETARASHKAEEQVMEEQKIVTNIYEAPTGEETITENSCEEEKGAIKQEEVKDSDLMSRKFRLIETDSAEKTGTTRLNAGEDPNRSSAIFIGKDLSDDDGLEKLDNISLLVSEVSTKHNKEDIQEILSVADSKVETSSVTGDTEKNLHESELETENQIDAVVLPLGEMPRGKTATEVPSGESLGVEALKLEKTLYLYDSANIETPGEESPADGRRYNMLEESLGALPESENRGTETTGNGSGFDNQTEEKLQEAPILPTKQQEYVSIEIWEKSKDKTPTYKDIQDKMLEIPICIQSKEQMATQIEPKKDDEETKMASDSIEKEHFTEFQNGEGAKMEKHHMLEPVNHIFEREKVVEPTQLCESSTAGNLESGTDKEMSEDDKTFENLPDKRETHHACAYETNEARDSTMSETSKENPGAVNASKMLRDASESDDNQRHATLTESDKPKIKEDEMTLALSVEDQMVGQNFQQETGKKLEEVKFEHDDQNDKISNETSRNFSLHEEITHEVEIAGSVKDPALEEVKDDDSISIDHSEATNWHEMTKPESTMSEEGWNEESSEELSKKEGCQILSVTTNSMPKVCEKNNEEEVLEKDGPTSDTLETVSVTLVRDETSSLGVERDHGNQVLASSIDSEEKRLGTVITTETSEQDDQAICLNLNERSASVSQYPTFEDENRKQEIVIGEQPKEKLQQTSRVMCEQQKVGISDKEVIEVNPVTQYVSQNTEHTEVETESDWNVNKSVTDAQDRAVLVATGVIKYGVPIDNETLDKNTVGVPSEIKKIEGLHSNKEEECQELEVSEMNAKDLEREVQPAEPMKEANLDSPPVFTDSKNVIESIDVVSNIGEMGAELAKAGEITVIDTQKDEKRMETGQKTDEPGTHIYRKSIYGLSEEPQTVGPTAYSGNDGLHSRDHVQNYEDKSGDSLTSLCDTTQNEKREEEIAEAVNQLQAEEVYYPTKNEVASPIHSLVEEILQDIEGECKEDTNLKPEELTKALESISEPQIHEILNETKTTERNEDREVVTDYNNGLAEDESTRNTIQKDQMVDEHLSGAGPSSNSHQNHNEKTSEANKTPVYENANEEVSGRVENRNTSENTEEKIKEEDPCQVSVRNTIQDEKKEEKGEEIKDGCKVDAEQNHDFKVQEIQNEKTCEANEITKKDEENQEVVAERLENCGKSEEIEKEVPREDGSTEKMDLISAGEKNITETHKEGQKRERCGDEVIPPVKRGEGQKTADEALLRQKLQNEIEKNPNEVNIQEVAREDENTKGQIPNQEETRKISETVEREARERSSMPILNMIDNKSSLSPEENINVKTDFKSETQVHASEPGDDTKLEEAEYQNEKLSGLSDTQPSGKEILEIEGTTKQTEGIEIPQSANEVVPTYTTSVKEEASTESTGTKISIASSAIPSIPKEPTGEALEKPQVEVKKSEKTSRIKSDMNEVNSEGVEESADEPKPSDSEQISFSDLLKRSTNKTSGLVGESGDQSESQAKEVLENGVAPTIQVEEEKTGQEQEEAKHSEEEENDEQKKSDSGSDAPVMVETSRDADEKTVHKKSHNILSGVGSKVKHSLAKVKKAITGKSSHHKPPSPKQEKESKNAT